MMSLALFLCAIILAITGRSNSIVEYLYNLIIYRPLFALKKIVLIRAVFTMCLLHKFCL